MTDPDVVIRRASETDVEAIARMLVDVETYYGAKTIDPVSVLEAQTRRALFGEPPLAETLICVDNTNWTLVGLVSFSALWPASGATHTLFVKELFVAEEHRGRGIGTLLFDQVVEIANSRDDCSRVEWTADRDNPSAIEFYARRGYSENLGKIYYRWVKPGP